MAIYNYKSLSETTIEPKLNDLENEMGCLRLYCSYEKGRRAFLFLIQIVQSVNINLIMYTDLMHCIRSSLF